MRETAQQKRERVGAIALQGMRKAQRGDHTGAIADFETAIRLDPQFPEPYHMCGLIKYELGQYESAILDFDTALKLNPEHADAHSYRGATKYELGQYESAILDFDTAVRLKPEFALTYYNRGRTRARLLQYTAAILDFDTALSLEKNPMLILLNYYHRGLAKGEIGDAASAKQDLTHAATLAKQAGVSGVQSEIEMALRVLDTHR